VTGPGDGFAIVVSANAKRGGRRVAAQIARALPGADVRLTKTAREVDAWLSGLSKSTRCVLAAGGDGTAIALVNALHRVNHDLPRMGVLPLGTGNAWAHVTGAPKLYMCLKGLEAASRPDAGTLPVRRFGLIECEGVLTHFAGAGWDAQILDDYRTQVSQSKGPSKLLSKSVYGYLAACLLRTVPKTLMNARPHVIIENLADEAWTITADRKLLKLAGVGRGSVLWDGPASVAGCATCPELGYGFRAYPFAERFLGMMNIRVYDEHTLGAVANIPALWRGQHPLRGMHDWFSKAVRMTFSRPVPLQIGGDAIGTRQSVEYRIFDQEIELLDWRGMPR
jgi:diacylglycerol kinase family enzyme